jgi:hypothetical protein
MTRLRVADAGTAAARSPAGGFPITPGHEVADVIAALPRRRSCAASAMVLLEPSRNANGTTSEHRIAELVLHPGQGVGIATSRPWAATSRALPSARR